MTAEVRVEPAEPRHAEGLSLLFGSTGYGCYCRFWHFDGTARDWLARCAQRQEENAGEMRSRLSSGSAEMQGLVAIDSTSELVGWLKLAPATVLTKLYGQRLYKGLGCLESDREGTFTVGCLLVREDYRRRGVARALLGGAIETAVGRGARALEAFPRGDTDVADAALMMGPLKLYLDVGFEVIHAGGPYPVLRLKLPGSMKAQ